MTTAKIVKLSTSELYPSPENRPDRSGFDAKSLAEMAGSFKAQGIIEPLIVRPAQNGKTGKGYEIVCGERRWTAAKLEGIPKEIIKDLGLQKLTEVPCVVTEMSDTEVREVRLIENLHREGIHPIEEAKAYRALLDEVEEVAKDARGASAGVPKKKYTIDTLARKLGKSPTFLYARLKLLKMPAFAQQAMFSGKLNSSVALLLCRIPDPKLAQKAAFEVLDTGYAPGDLTDEQREKRALDPENDPMSFRAAKTHIQTQYMIRLKGAPFDQEDAALVAAVVAEGERICGGKCSDCPLRTGNMKALFADIDSADVCTNPTCFQLKKKAAFKKEQERFKAKGQVLLSDGKARNLLDYEGKELNASARAQFIDLRENIPGKRKQTWEEALTPHLPQDADVFVARGHKNHVLVPIEQAIQAAEKAGIKLEKPKAPADDYSPENRKKQEEERTRKTERSNKIFSDVMIQLGLAITRAKPEHTLRFVAAGLFDNWQYLQRHGLDVEEGDKAMEKHLAQLTTLPLLMEAMVEATLPRVVDHTGELDPSIRELCEYFDIALDKITAKQATARLNAMETAEIVASKADAKAKK